MASKDLLRRWNETDEIGTIQPPLSESEVESLSRYDVYPESIISYGTYRDMARTALIMCPHIRLPGNPDLTAQAMAAFK